MPTLEQLKTYTAAKRLGAGKLLTDGRNFWKISDYCNSDRRAYGRPVEQVFPGVFAEAGSYCQLPDGLEAFKGEAVFSFFPAMMHRKIETIEQAKAYLEALESTGYMHHLEDDPFDIIWTGGYEAPGIADLQLLKRQANACYNDAFDWAEHECPIGYVLDLKGFDSDSED